MADSTKRAHAHNTILTRFNALNAKAKNQLFDLLALIIARKAGNDIKMLLILNENGQQRYAGNSVDIATTIYLSVLDRAIEASQQYKNINIEFYAIDRNDVKQDLGGVQS